MSTSEEGPEPVTPVENLYGRVALCDLSTLCDAGDEGRSHRARLFPSAKDFITVASHGTASYRVYTPYVYDSPTGAVCKTSSADPADRLEYEIIDARCIGADHQRHSIYHATLEGRVGQLVIFRLGVWVVADATGRDGQLELSPP